MVSRSLKDIDKTWTLFLDRDGTINKRIEDKYVIDWNGFEFLDGVLDSMALFNRMFYKTMIVTNQQGIGKELMSHEELQLVHTRMIEEFSIAGAYIDQIYYCPDLAIYNPSCRKPNPGMALKAREDFPEIEFTRSIMVGDENTDIEFGKNLKMLTVKIGKHDQSSGADIYVDTLQEFAFLLQEESIA